MRGPRFQVQREGGLGYLHFSAIQVPKRTGKEESIAVQLPQVCMGTWSQEAQDKQQWRLVDWECFVVLQPGAWTFRQEGWNSSPACSSVCQGCQEFHHPTLIKTSKRINRERINGKDWTSSHDGLGHIGWGLGVGLTIRIFILTSWWRLGQKW